MKKNFVIFLVMMFASTCCFASDIEVESGSAKVLKENATAIVEFDFTNTTWEEDESFKTWCGKDYEARLEAMQEAFIESFNENTKGLKIDNGATGAKYKIVVVVKDLERHQSFTGTWGQGKFSTTGTINIIEISSSQKVCEIEVDGYGSGKDYAYTRGLAKCFTGLGKQVTKLK